jgi:hypothetical protein
MHEDRMAGLYQASRRCLVTAPGLRRGYLRLDRMAGCLDSDPLHQRFQSEAPPGQHGVVPRRLRAPRHKNSPGGSILSVITSSNGSNTFSLNDLRGDPTGLPPAVYPKFVVPYSLVAVLSARQPV